MTPERLASGFHAVGTDLYPGLFAMTARDQALNLGGRVRGGQPDHLLVRADVLDLIAVVETLILALEQDLRVELGWPSIVRPGRTGRDAGGVAPDPRVPAACTFLADVAFQIVAAGYGDHVAGLLFGDQRTRGVVSQCRAVLGRSERCFRPADVICPHCECRSLIARRPSSGIIECVNSNCTDSEGRRHRWDAATWSPYAAAEA